MLLPNSSFTEFAIPPQGSNEQTNMQKSEKQIMTQKNGQPHQKHSSGTTASHKSFVNNCPIPTNQNTVDESIVLTTIENKCHLEPSAAIAPVEAKCAAGRKLLDNEKIRKLGAEAWLCN